MRLVLTALALSLALPAAAHAASYDCNRAKAPDEKAVCAYLPLNDKDVRMSVLYEINKRTLAMGGRGAIQDAQQRWRRDRRSCGANRACLNRAYDRRLGELERSLDRIYRNGPF